MGTATAVGNTTFFELNPATGENLDTYNLADGPPGPIDNVLGMAVVDYVLNRVYFGTNGSAFTLWGLDLGPPGTPDLKLAPVAWNPQGLGGGGTIGAPVMRNGRLYLGTDTGAAAAVFSLRVSDGTLYGLTHGDGQVKGFVWPDRRDDKWVYFTTNGQVHGAVDDGTSLKAQWSLNVASPSIPLQKPGTDFLYVGDGNGNLVQIDLANPVPAGVRSLKLSPRDVQIGAPSLDNVFSMVHVGSDDGVIYAVRVPF
jgi:hypothetical protein